MVAVLEQGHLVHHHVDALDGHAQGGNGVPDAQEPDLGPHGVVAGYEILGCGLALVPVSDLVFVVGVFN